MSKGFQGRVLKILGAQNYPVTVVEVCHTTARVRRVRFSAPSLFKDYEPKPTGWLRFWFPDPDNPEKQHQRGYTIIEPDMKQREFCVDFLLHQPSGPASKWVMQAETGQQLTATLYGASEFAPQESARGYLLIGDGASLPAINSIIAVLEDQVPIYLYFAIYEAEDRSLPITQHPLLNVNYVDVSLDNETSALAEAIEVRDWSNWMAWVATESKAVRAVKKVLKDIHGFSASELKAQAYWVRASTKKSRW